jgi:hypothetical protein
MTGGMFDDVPKVLAFFAIVILLIGLGLGWLIFG